MRQKRPVEGFGTNLGSSGLVSSDLTESLAGMDTFDPNTFNVEGDSDVDMSGSNNKGKGVDKDTNFE